MVHGEAGRNTPVSCFLAARSSGAATSLRRRSAVLPFSVPLRGASAPSVLESSLQLATRLDRAEAGITPR